MIINKLMLFRSLREADFPKLCTLHKRETLYLYMTLVRQNQKINSCCKFFCDRKFYLILTYSAARRFGVPTQRVGTRKTLSQDFLQQEVIS